MKVDLPAEKVPRIEISGHQGIWVANDCSGLTAGPCVGDAVELAEALDGR